MKDFIELTRKIERIAGVNGGRGGDARDVTAATAAYLNILVDPMTAHDLLIRILFRRCREACLFPQPLFEGTNAQAQAGPQFRQFFAAEDQEGDGHDDR